MPDKGHLPSQPSAFQVGRMDLASVTDVGMVRKDNQDSIYVPPPPGSLPASGLLVAVADGMGGHQGGQIASSNLVKCLAQYYTDQKSGSPRDILKNLVLDANRTLYRMSRQDPDLTGMGTTMTAALIEEGKVSVLQVGDSRAYHRRGSTLTQITVDHSLVNEELQKGLITPEEAKTHPKRNVITRAVGTRPFLDIDIYEVELKEGDDLLLCSDGLHGMVSDPDILSLMQRGRDASEAAAYLLDSALTNGGLDNIGIVLLRCSTPPGFFRRILGKLIGRG